MLGYIEFSLWVFTPFVIAYVLHKLNMPDDFVMIPMLIGFLMSIYWILLTTVTIVFGIKKLIELGSMDLFIQEFLRSVRK